MKYRKLGKGGPEVSVIGFGAWAIGGTDWGKTDDQVSKKALFKALDNGVNFIDTADIYGFGHSEKLISEVVHEKKYNNIIIATKAGNSFKKVDGKNEIYPDYSINYLIKAAENSLKRLRTDQLDILQLHSPDIETLNRDEPWQALRKLKESGKIKYAGLSIRSFEETKQAKFLEDYSGLLQCVQIRYNIFERDAEKVLLPKARKLGIGVIVRIPLLFGFLSGKFSAQSRFSEDDHRRLNLSPQKLKVYLEKLEKINPLFEKYKNQLKAQISLRFAITHPACSVAIPGAKNEQQVTENTASADFGLLSEDDLELIRKI